MRKLASQNDAERHLPYRTSCQSLQKGSHMESSKPKNAFRGSVRNMGSMRDAVIEQTEEGGYLFKSPPKSTRMCQSQHLVISLKRTSSKDTSSPVYRPCPCPFLSRSRSQRQHSEGVRKKRVKMDKLVEETDRPPPHKLQGQRT